MEIFTLSLICLITVVTGGVLDDLGVRSEGSRQGDESNVGRIGSHRLTQMTQEELVRQKFLLDILQNVNEPSLNEELQNIAPSQYENLVGDRNLYIGGIDEQMEHVIELSGIQQLLGKEEVFTIANDEHLRQMNGLYRLLVRSRDWVTLQRNILHARVQVNGVLFVNSLLLTIRDRDDTQNLLMPGIHEILPELYLDKNVVRRAHDISINQLTTSRNENQESESPGILELIALNKMRSINTKEVDSLDRHELWMPWRKMRMDIQARKVGGVKRPTHVSGHGDASIVLEATQSSNAANHEDNVRLLTADVGFQSFIHSFINDLCVNEAEENQQNRKQKDGGSIKSNLARVALERNMGSMLESEIRRSNEQYEGEEVREKHSENIDTDRDPQIEGTQRYWSGANGNIEERSNAVLSKSAINREQVATRRRVNLRDDEDVSSQDSQSNLRTRFMDTTHQRRVSVNNNVNNVNRLRSNLNMNLGMDMPMDWNRQMAIHRHRVNPVEYNNIIGTQNPTHLVNNNNDQRYQVGVNLPQVEVDNERLLPVGRRRPNQLSRSREQDEQQQQTTVNDSQLWKNGLKTGQTWRKDIPCSDAINNRRQVVDSKNWGPQFSKNRGTINSVRRPIAQREDEHDLSMQERDDSNGVNMFGRRLPRSLTSDAVTNRQLNIEKSRSAELLLHNLQQLMARINMEHISLGWIDELQLQDTTNPSRFNNPRLTNAAEERLALRLNDMRMNTRRNGIILDRIKVLENILQKRIKQEIIDTVGAKEKVNARNNADIDRLIGDMLIGKRAGVQDVNILNVLRNIIRQDDNIYRGVQKLTDITMNVADPIILHLLRRIVRLTDEQRQKQLGSYRSEEIEMSGVTINDVKVDKFKTFVETSDVDLINALDARQTLNANRGVEQFQRMVVERQQRLNHKSFNINIDVTSDRDQRVVVRTLLGPKTDAAGRVMRMNEQRQNFMLLDAQIVDLRNGRNQIKRNSRDINWTARDTTPFTEIYKRVVQALSGQVESTLDQVEGQNCRFPHRLLLPRGRVDGLSMQMLVVITPVEDDDTRTTQELKLSNRICGIGMASVNLDRLPLGFPLDRPIDDQQQIASLPNVHLGDVQIYHDNQLKVQNWVHEAV